MKVSIVGSGRTSSENVSLCVDPSLIVGHEPTVSVQVSQSSEENPPHAILSFTKVDRTALREWATGLLAAADFLDQEVSQ